MDAQFSTALDGLETKLNALLTSLTTPTAVGAPGAAVALLEADDGVSSALETLRTHQANYAKILQLRTEAQNLEERIKTIVQELSSAGQEIAHITGDSDDADDDYDSDADEDDEDLQSASGSESDLDDSKQQQQGQRWGNSLKSHKRKEVDYKLLLEFARRISKYNPQAAADATTGIAGTKSSTTRKLQEKQLEDAKMIDANGVDAANTQEDHTSQLLSGKEREDVTVGAVTKEATSWLEESADADRKYFMIPYPNEDRIRMGLMGQLQLAAVEGKIDPEKEAERLVQASEGLLSNGDGDKIGIQTDLGFESVQARPPTHADEAARAAMRAGAHASTRPSSGNNVQQSRPTLNLDLYDPEDDD